MLLSGVGCQVVFVRKYVDALKPFFFLFYIGLVIPRVCSQCKKNIFSQIGMNMFLICLLINIEQKEVEILKLFVDR